jgi:hypothetical protein
MSMYTSSPFNPHHEDYVELLQYLASGEAHLLLWSLGLFAISDISHK